MVKTIVTPDKANVNIAVPESYIGKKVEVLMYAVDELIDEKPKKNGMAQFLGILSNETADDLHRNVEKSRNEWDRDI